MSQVTSYAYDLSGNVVTKGLPNNYKELRTHDGRNRVSTLNNQHVSLVITGYAYEYDPVGNVMEIDESYNSSVLMPNRTITNTYDNCHRLLTEEIAVTGGSTTTTTYDYDAGHNRTSRAVSGGSTTSYTIGTGGNGAGANQIVSETDSTTGFETAYGYDANGNRTSRQVDNLITTGNTTSSSTTISSIPSTTGIAVGMGIRGTGIPSGATVATIASSTSITISAAATATGTGVTITLSLIDDYSYDFEQRLIELDYHTGASNTGTYQYAYDYRTRRTARTEPGPTTTNIIFNGGTSIEEYTSSASSPTVEFIRGFDYGGGVGGINYSVRSGVMSNFYYNSRGDMVANTHSTTIGYQGGYEAFGTITQTRGSTVERQKANTKEEDPTGLLNEGFRYRDLSMGTFITRDPLGFNAGPNMYTYVSQNPWSKFDPEGLQMAPPILEIIEPRVAPVEEVIPAPAPTTSGGSSGTTTTSSAGRLGPAPLTTNPSATGPAGQTKVDQTQREVKDTTLYRAMKADPQHPDQPLTGADKRSLGALIGPLPPNSPPNQRADITPVNGMVSPGQDGMSVAPNSPMNLPSNRRPADMGGTGKDPVWSIQQSQLGLGLKYQQDAPGHGTVQPAMPMAPQQYQKNIQQTQPYWHKVNPIMGPPVPPPSSPPMKWNPKWGPLV